MAEVICGTRTTREINAELRALIARGETNVLVQDPKARHNLGVAIIKKVTLKIDGSVGYYCAGLIDGATVEVSGSAGWGLAESMLEGHVVVKGSAGNGAAAAIRGGTVVIHGDAGARLGVSMKGGIVVVGGNCGYMGGFMGQKGTLVVCGDTGAAFADSMYETECFVGGKIGELGNDATVSQLGDEEVAFLEDTLTRLLPLEIRRSRPPAKEFRKIVAGRKLWNFEKREWKTWQEAL